MRQKWLVAQKNHLMRDSKGLLESLGFEIVCARDNFFYEVHPPNGWQMKVQGGHWTTFVDKTGITRLTQYYENTLYKRYAFVTDW